MSMEQARVLIEKMKSDISFREQVKSIENIDARMEFVNREGFLCKIDEISKILEELNLRPKQSSGLCSPLCHPDHCWC